MRHFLNSFSRITLRVGFLAMALFLGLVFFYLPTLLNFNAFRPRLVGLLEKTFCCTVFVGNIQAVWIPYPGFIIENVVFIEPARHSHVLAWVEGIHVGIGAKPLLHGQLRFLSIRFIRPRFIFHRESGPNRQPLWDFLALPQKASAGEKNEISVWEIRNGSLEIWDHTVHPTARWEFNRLNGSFQTRTQTGALSGNASCFGKKSSLTLHYEKSAEFPLDARLNDIELNTFRPFLQGRMAAFLQGMADLSVKVRMRPSFNVHAELEKITGSGSVLFLVAAGAKGWDWSAMGKNFSVEGTAFRLPEWWARGDHQRLSVRAQAVTREGGSADVSWTHQIRAQESTLDINVSSVTVRQVLEIFDLQSKRNPSTEVPGSLKIHPFGYEPWRISQGSLHSLIKTGKSLDVLEGIMDIEGMHVSLKGSFGLKKNSLARIQGTLQNIPVAPVVESFFTPPSPMTGASQMTFSLTFPLSKQWVQGLTGAIQVQCQDGILHMFKTFYRIVSVLNLGNYMRLRLPQVTAKGILFQAITGHLNFQNGVMTTKDLFLKSTNMNIGARGTLDILGKSINTVLRIEILRFIEEILKATPITHWLFKEPNKILFPLTVAVEGPWTDVDVY